MYRPDFKNLELDNYFFLNSLKDFSVIKQFFSIETLHWIVVCTCRCASFYSGLHLYTVLCLLFPFDKTFGDVALSSNLTFCWWRI